MIYVKITPKGMVAYYYLDHENDGEVYTTTRHRLSYHADGYYHYNKSLMNYNAKTNSSNQTFGVEKIDPLETQDKQFNETFSRDSGCD